MNEQLTKYARFEIKSALHKLPETHFRLFKQMYSHKNMDATIDEAVDNMPDEKLDWALTQCQNSLRKLI